MPHTKDPRYEKIEADLQRLAADVGHLIGEKREEGAERLHYAADVARQKYERARQVAQAKGEEVDEWAHGHVWTTAAIAAAVGAVLGMMGSRRRRY